MNLVTFIDFLRCSVVRMNSNIVLKILQKIFFKNNFKNLLKFILPYYNPLKGPVIGYKSFYFKNYAGEWDAVCLRNDSCLKKIENKSDFILKKE